MSTQLETWMIQHGNTIRLQGRTYTLIRIEGNRPEAILRVQQGSRQLHGFQLPQSAANAEVWEIVRVARGRRRRETAFAVEGARIRPLVAAPKPRTRSLPAA